MINTQKAILVYNKSTSLNLNTQLNSTVASKIEQIQRVDPITGNAFQVWAPNAVPPVRNFGSLTCGNVYIIETLAGVALPYQLSNDGSDDGLRSINDYDKTICTGITPTPIPTLTPTPTTPNVTSTPTKTPTPTPTKTPTPTPTLPKQLVAVASETLCSPDTLPCQGQTSQTLYYNSGGPKPPESTLDLVSICQNSELSLNWKQAQTVDDTTKGPPIQLKISGAFVGIMFLEKQYYASQEFVNPSLSDGATIRYKCLCSLYEGKITSTFLNNPELDPSNLGGIVHLDLINDQCPPTPTPSSTPTKTPTPTATSNKITIIASRFNAFLGNTCNSGVVCPSEAIFGPTDCCGTTGQLEYEGSALDGLISYQSVGYNSIISFDPLSSITPTGTPVIVILKLPNGAYFGSLTMNTNNFIGRSFEINNNGTRYSGTFGPEVIMTQI